MPLGTEKSALFGASGGVDGNYFGDGSDGALTTSGDVNLALPAGNDMVVANYTDLDISSGDTLTVASANRGLLLYCSGNLIVDGTLSMSLRGGNADPTTAGGSDSAAVSGTGLRLPMFTASGSDTLAAADFAGCGNTAVAAVANQPAIAGDGTIFVVSQLGATGASGASSTNVGNNGNAGTTGGATISTGGGASGGSQANHGSNSTGAGGRGGAFSSGAGSGGTGRQPGVTSGAGDNYGGNGSSGVCGGGCGGGWGNGSGGGANNEGHGGLLWVVVKGTITVGASGSIEAHGGRGQMTGLGAAAGAGGGGTGGGAIHVLHGGTLTNNGSIAANGGASGATVGSVVGGGTGGAGGVNTAQVTA
jgi:hypothetical protein